MDLISILCFVLDSRCCVCETPVTRLSFCKDCHPTPLPPAQDSAFFSSFEFNSKAQKLLHLIKYQKKDQFLSLLIPFLPTIFPWKLGPSTKLVPVPLSKDRFLERGFNQAEWLADQISVKTHLAAEKNGLLKARNTSPQSILNKRDRENNLLGAFMWNPHTPIPQQAILIDDVFTTGATLKACSNILKNAGITKVYGWTLFKKDLF